MCSSPCRHRHTLCQSCIIHPFQRHNKQLVYFTLPIIEILKVVWLLIEWEIHVGGVLHHSSPPSTKRLWHISLEAPTASPLLSVHNLMAAVTAQLIHDGPLSSIPITSFSETLLIYMLDCSLTRCCHFLPSSGKWWKTFWSGTINLKAIVQSQAENNLVLWEVKEHSISIHYLLLYSYMSKNKTLKHLKIINSAVIDKEFVCTNSRADWTELVKWELLCWMNNDIYKNVQWFGDIASSDVQICLSEWKRSGLNTPPWGAPLLTVCFSPESRSYDCLVIKPGEIFYSCCSA